MAGGFNSAFKGLCSNCAYINNVCTPKDTSESPARGTGIYYTHLPAKKLAAFLWDLKTNMARFDL